MKRHVVRPRACLSLGLFACSVCLALLIEPRRGVVAGEGLPPDDTILASWSFTEHRWPPLATVRAGGSDLTMAIALANSYSALRQDHLSAFTEKRGELSIPHHTGALSVPVFQFSSVSSRKWRANDIPFFALPAGNSAIKLMHRRIDGFLGAAAFSKVCLQIDPDSSSVRVLEKYAPQEADRTYKLFRDGDSILMRLRFDQYHDVLLQTGEPIGVMLQPAVVATLVAEGRAVSWTTFDESGGKEELEAELVGLGKSPKTAAIPQTRAVGYSEVVLRELLIGEQSLKNVVCGPGPHMALGMGILSRFRVTFDFPNGRVHLAPAAGVDRPERPMVCGFFLLCDAPGYRVSVVFADTPAAEAGLRYNDQIVTVNGIDANTLSYERMVDQMNRAGHPLRLGIRRDGRDLSIVVQLAPCYEYPPKWPDRKTAVIRDIPSD
jgi:hypothetical protein